MIFRYIITKNNNNERQDHDMEGRGIGRNTMEIKR